MAQSQCAGANRGRAAVGVGGGEGKLTRSRLCESIAIAPVVDDPGNDSRPDCVRRRKGPVASQCHTACIGDASIACAADRIEIDVSSENDGVCKGAVDEVFRIQAASIKSQCASAELGIDSGEAVKLDTSGI